MLNFFASFLSTFLTIFRKQKRHEQSKNEHGVITPYRPTHARTQPGYRGCLLVAGRCDSESLTTRSPARPKTLILLQLVTETPDLGDGVFVLFVQIGFKNKRCNTIRMLRKAVNKGILPPAVVEATRTAFFLPKETLVSKFKRRFWTAWRLGIYNFLVSHSVISHIHFPPS